jgi:hypothetical protein
MAKKKSYSPSEIAALMEAFDKSYLTITRWIVAGNDKLTSDKAKKALEKIK